MLAGNSMEGLRDVVYAATPTIPPMARSPYSNMVPDYMVGPRADNQSLGVIPRDWQADSGVSVGCGWQSVG